MMEDFGEHFSQHFLVASAPPGSNRDSEGLGLSQEGCGSLISECGLLSESTLRQEVISMNI